ncbi:hypothetical protein MNBD_GAMMA12-1254 [hydrothermal vent metagenome]|uniref:Uncharacterized protein n=1 Tax=hydrothermal vent metagenome TaxID=652676 RepID=A0A3B0XS85_9ZZZZ
MSFDLKRLQILIVYITILKRVISKDKLHRKSLILM